MSKLMEMTLEEASSNGDGTYNGLTAMRWLYETITGKELSPEEAENLYEEALRNLRNNTDAQA